MSTVNFLRHSTSTFKIRSGGCCYLPVNILFNSGNRCKNVSIFNFCNFSVYSNFWVFQLKRNRLEQGIKSKIKWFCFIFRWFLSLEVRDFFDFDIYQCSDSPLNPDQPCVTSCNDTADGNHASCVGCHVYVTCDDGTMTDRRPCPPALVFDARSQTCVEISENCVDDVTRSKHIEPHLICKINECVIHI